MRNVLAFLLLLAACAELPPPPAPLPPPGPADVRWTVVADGIRYDCVATPMPKGTAWGVHLAVTAWSNDGAEHALPRDPIRLGGSLVYRKNAVLDSFFASGPADGAPSRRVLPGEPADFEKDWPDPKGPVEAVKPGGRLLLDLGLLGGVRLDVPADGKPRLAPTTEKPAPPT